VDEKSAGAALVQADDRPTKAMAWKRKAPAVLRKRALDGDETRSLRSASSALSDATWLWV